MRIWHKCRNHDTDEQTNERKSGCERDREWYYHTTHWHWYLTGVLNAACCLLSVSAIDVDETMKRWNDGMIEWLTKTDDFILFHQCERLNLLESVWAVSSFLLYPHLLNNNQTHKPKPSYVIHLRCINDKSGWTKSPKCAIAISAQTMCAMCAYVYGAFVSASHTFNNHKYNGNSNNNNKFEYIHDYDRCLWTHWTAAVRQCVRCRVVCAIGLCSADAHNEEIIEMRK